MKKKQIRDEKIILLKKALLKRKYYSIFLALFTLGINIFAWFVFSTTAQVGLDATVASWDVQFRDDSGDDSKIFVIDITKMKPGMNNYSKTISAHNHSDVTADFIYEISEFQLLGHTIQINDQTTMINYLQSNYPFSVSFTASKTVLNPSDTVDFDIGLVWPYESSTPIYYKQDDVYQFDSSFPYYQLSNGIYTLANVNSSTYNSLKSNLYIEKDDADSYFGMKCHEYEESTGKACLSLTLKLLVRQRNT